MANIAILKKVSRDIFLKHCLHDVGYKNRNILFQYYSTILINVIPAEAGIQAAVELYFCFRQYSWCLQISFDLVTLLLQ